MGFLHSEQTQKDEEEDGEGVLATGLDVEESRESESVLNSPSLFFFGGREERVQSSARVDDEDDAGRG